MMNETLKAKKDTTQVAWVYIGDDATQLYIGILLSQYKVSL